MSSAPADVRPVSLPFNDDADPWYPVGMKMIHTPFVVAVAVSFTAGCGTSSFDADVDGQSIGGFNSALFGLVGDRVDILLGATSCQAIEDTDLIGKTDAFARLQTTFNTAVDDQARADAFGDLEDAAPALFAAHDEVFPLDTWTMNLSLVDGSGSGGVGLTLSPAIDDGTLDVEYIGTASFAQKKTSPALRDDGVVDFGGGDRYHLSGELSIDRFDTATDGGIELAGNIEYAEYTIDADGEAVPVDEDGPSSANLKFSAQRCTAMDL